MKRLTDNRGLGSVQVLMLMLGFLLASVLIFVFGYALGQEMALRHALQSDRVVRATAPPRPTYPPPSAGVSPGFYKEMQEKAFQRAGEQSETRVPVATEPPPSASPTAPRAVPTAPRATATVRKPTPTMIPRLPTVGAVSEPGVRWSIQVGATKDAQEAANLMLELRRQGFQAYTAQAQLGSEVSYRVRVGHFASRAEAEAVERTLRKDNRFGGAYVTSQ